MSLSFQAYQPYGPEGYARGALLYDPRGDSSPYLYSTGATYVWSLNRRTGVITPYHGQFDPEGGSFGPADMDQNGNLWWIGDEPNNLTAVRQAQTKFAADTLTKIGSMTSDGSTVLYPAAGQVRVDRHSSNHLVWQIDQGDAHDVHGNLQGWDGITRVRTYFIARATWYDQPTGGVLNRVWDFDSDGDGNLWCVTLDDSSLYLLLWKVTPGGTQTMVTNLSTTFAGNLGIPMIRWVASDNSLVVGAANLFAKCQVSDGAVVGTAASPITIQYGEHYQSFHHTIDNTSLYLSQAQITGPIFYEINLLTLATDRSIDFAGVSGCVGVFWNGFSQSYDAPRYFRPITALYDPVLGGVWCEEFFSGVLAAFIFGDSTPEEIRTTQLVIEVVVRPHPPSTPITPPPPIIFIGEQLYSITGPSLPMEVCTGYVGKPAVLTQLFKVQPQYNKGLAPVSSQLHLFYTEQIGEHVTQGHPGVLGREEDWFFVRQTGRYHRVCLLCVGDTEVTALTWLLREAGIR